MWRLFLVMLILLFMREETLVFDAHVHLPKFSDPTVWLCGFVVSMFADVLWL